jgi:hypothetical protein
MSTDHLNNAIALAEISGKSFRDLQKREKNYVKLAKYLRDCKYECTHADLVEDLPFFRGSSQSKQDMIKLAQGYGYKNNIVIKSYFLNGIEFLSASSLQKTSLDHLIVSTSKDITQGFIPSEIRFDQLTKFGKVSDFNWCNHHFKDNYRSEDTTIKGFNLIVLDVDSSVSIDTAKILLAGYKAIIYTTKRHTPTSNRYRIILPTNYILELEEDTYKDFMQNLYTWLPFEADLQTGQRSRKWLCNKGNIEVLEGELIDVLPFIPQTQKNEERIKAIIPGNSLDGLERWFVNNIGLGNRNNQLLRYAYALVDAGKDISEISHRIFNVNAKLPEPLSTNEIKATILQSAAKKIKSGGN